MLWQGPNGDEYWWPANRRLDVPDEDVAVTFKLGMGSAGQVFFGFFQGKAVAVKYLKNSRPAK
jgi:hypothetical protein